MVNPSLNILFKWHTCILPYSLTLLVSGWILITFIAVFSSNWAYTMLSSLLLGFCNHWLEDFVILLKMDDLGHSHETRTMSEINYVTWSSRMCRKLVTSCYWFQHFYYVKNKTRFLSQVHDRCNKHYVKPNVAGGSQVPVFKFYWHIVRSIKIIWNQWYVVTDFRLVIPYHVTNLSRVKMYTFETNKMIK